MGITMSVERYTMTDLTTADAIAPGENTDGDVPAADGGPEMRTHFPEDDVQRAVDEAAPEAADAAGIYELLEFLQRSVEQGWNEWLDNIERGGTTLVYEDDDVLVFSTGEHRLYGEILQPYQGPVPVDDDTVDAVSRVHHAVARRLADYNWGVAYPMVVAKPQGANAGRSLVEAHIAWLMHECGLSGGVALDYYMTEWRGYSQASWARRAGKDQGTVSQNVSKARSAVVR